MKTSTQGLTLIAGSEGLRLHAYPDPGSGGEPYTIGYGHTGQVKPDDVCTKEQAMAWLAEDVRYAEACVNLQAKVPLTQGQFDALTSLIFNIGQGAFNASTLLRLLNQSDYTGAANQFARWCHGPNGILPGLVARRAKEREMFLNGQ